MREELDSRRGLSTCMTPLFGTPGIHGAGAGPQCAPTDERTDIYSLGRHPLPDADGRPPVCSGDDPWVSAQKRGHRRPGRAPRAKSARFPRRRGARAARDAAGALEERHRTVAALKAEPRRPGTRCTVTGLSGRLQAPRFRMSLQGTPLLAGALVGLGFLVLATDGFPRGPPHVGRASRAVGTPGRSPRAGARGKTAVHVQGLGMVPLSILDLAPIVEGGTAGAGASALARARAPRRAPGLPAVLARRAPQHAGHRERGHGRRGRAHRGGHIDHQGRLRAAMMLPNHAPLTIAEQFGTLESLFPGRIDLGLGRAPGHGPVHRRALRRGQGRYLGHFPAGRGRAAVVLQGVRPGAGRARRPRIGTGGAPVAPWLQPLQRPAGRDARACPMPSRRTLHPTFLSGALELYRSAVSSLGLARRSPTPWRRSPSSRPTRTRRPRGCSRRSSRPSST